MSLTGLEWTVVTWLLFAVKVEARTDNLLDFVYFSSCCLLPFHHGGWFIVPAQHSPENVISQAMHEVFDCPFGVRLSPHDSCKLIKCCHV